MNDFVNIVLIVLVYCRCLTFLLLAFVNLWPFREEACVDRETDSISLLYFLSFKMVKCSDLSSFILSPSLSAFCLSSCLSRSLSGSLSHRLCPPKHEYISQCLPINPFHGCSFCLPILMSHWPFSTVMCAQLVLTGQNRKTCVFFTNPLLTVRLALTFRFFVRDLEFLQPRCVWQVLGIT